MGGFPEPMTAAAIVPLGSEWGGEVTLFLVPLDVYARDACLDELGPAERLRAARMLPQVGRRYLAAQHALRAVLGATLNVPAARVRIESDTQGKPCVESEAVQFNLSRSANLCLIAVSVGRPVGVDIERARELKDVRALAQAALTPAELREWAKERNHRVLLRCWTRKEACLKAVGVGLSVAPHDVEVGLGGDERVVAMPLPAGHRPVRVRSIDRADYCAAVALAPDVARP